MTKQVSTHLMFNGCAEEAVRFYAGLFAKAALEKVEFYSSCDGGPKGKVKQAVLLIGSQRIVAFDSPVKHEFGMTPSMSLYVECDTGAELEGLSAALAEGGTVLMPLDDNELAVRSAWVSDRFGLSWQLCHEAG